MPVPRLSLRVAGALLALGVPVSVFAQGDAAAPTGIKLLEPVGGVTEIPTTGNEGLGVFGFYFGLLYPWVVGMGAGIAVLMGVIGGIQIIRAGADAGEVSAGKNRLLASLGGLLLILLSATLMNALNPVFFR